MVSSSRQAIACILLLFGAAFYTYSQTVPGKTATITGKITLKGKGVAGVTVLVADHNNTSTRYKGTSDQLGNYRITNIRPGSYEVTPLTQSLVVENERPGRILLLAEGETVDDLNFALVRGGVITGKITDPDGQPIIEEQVSLIRVEDSEPAYGQTELVQTDDRGIYRIFGVRQGKYKVSVGHGDIILPGNTRELYRQTFHPSVTDPAKATIIEVTEGSESSNVDIVVGRAVTTYTVSGRIIDEETGKPLPKVTFGVQQTVGNSTHSSMGGITSNAQGEFKLEGTLPGRYLIFFASSENTEVRPDSISVDVVDRDITGLLIKAAKGASVSGVVVIEGEDKPNTEKSGELHIQAFSPNSSGHSDHRQPVIINADGSFKIGGLRSGTVHLSVFGFPRRKNPTRLGIVRIERNGAILPSGEIELKDGEQLAGLRVVVQHLSGSLRGVVKLQDGDLPPNARISASLRFAEGSALKYEVSLPAMKVDSRGRFSADGLAPATYEVNIWLTLPGGELVRGKQQVTVTDNVVSDVVVTLNKPNNP